MNYEEARLDAARALNETALTAIEKRDRELAADASYHRRNLLAAVGEEEVRRELEITTTFLARI